ncbi:MAG: prepilin-type N-terminal cleavage/methylation domain-containing protein [Verrucomicrobia bacterium]|nr:prepilin-type N-terminal cleavage/methylation domain-containing protein [Verrucomicrobiota bacterium]
MKRNTQNCAGLSLAEVIVAMALFSLGMLGLFSMSSQLRLTRQLSADLSASSLLASTTLESLRADGVPAMGSGSTTTGRFTVAWMVVTNSGYMSRNVQVQVAWSDLRNRAHTQTVSAVVAP